MLNNVPFNQFIHTKKTVDIAQELLGYELIYNGPHGTVGGLITETEAYTEDDPACHAFNGKKTKRNAPMFLPAGHIYIYFIYGMYHCLNIVTEQEGVGSAVLIRELRPTIGLNIIKKNRPKITAQQNLLNGPSKLMLGLGIPTELNGTSILSDNCPIKLIPHKKPYSTKKLPRIGISKGTDRLWRFRYTEKKS